MKLKVKTIILRLSNGVGGLFLPSHNAREITSLKLGSYAPYLGCIFGHVNGVFKNLHPGANLLLRLRSSKFICTRLHPGAICAYERRMFNFHTFLSGILIYCRPFLFRSSINRYFSKFYIVFIKMKIRLFIRGLSQ